MPQRRGRQSAPLSRQLQQRGAPTSGTQAFRCVGWCRAACCVQHTLIGFETDSWWGDADQAAAAQAAGMFLLLLGSSTCSHNGRLP